MLKHEFEELAMIDNESIPSGLFEAIHGFYMSTNEYHAVHGGVDETKQEFVNRVFDGKVNTVKSIAKKLLFERMAENAYCLQGIADKERLDRINELLAEQTAWNVYERCNHEYWTMKEYLKKEALNK